MTKDVLMALKGLQFDGESQDDYTTILPAEYYFRNGKHYVVYDEVMEGFAGTTKNIIKFTDSEMDVSKKGIVNVHLFFEENRKNLASYGTPFGEIMVGINATKIELQESEDLIHIDVDYDLELNYQHLADCKISLEIRPLEKSESLF